MVYRVTLPSPISANRYWRSFVPKGWTRAVVAPSKEAKAYREECSWRAVAAGVRLIDGAVELRICLYPKDRRLLDLDNALKVLIDSLRGVAYADDKQVWRIVAERRDPDGVGRVEVEVLPYVMPTALELAA